MKQVLIFVGGNLAGIFAMFLFSKSQAEDPPANNALPQKAAEKGAEKGATWHPLKRESLAFEYGKPLFIRDQSGAEYQLSFNGVMGAPIEYHWHGGSSNPSKGSGTVFEKLEVVGKSDRGREVRDAGSDVVLEINGLHLEWSPKDQASGWIYFDSGVITVGTEQANRF